jgi:2-dehydropantoate 2-reductase
LIATKSSGLQEAIRVIEGFVGPDTIIISLLNGISSEEIIAEKFGRDKILYSLFIGHISTRVGNIITHDGVGTIVFGEADNTVISEKTAAARDFFDKAGIDYKIPPNMFFALWSKFMINVGFNQASAVLLAPYKVFHECDKAMDIAYKLMEEVIAIAGKAGARNPDKMLESAMGIVRAMPPEAKSSMLQDVEGKRLTEVDIFAGTVCKLGEKYGVSTPYNDVFLRVIRAIEQKNMMGMQ